MKDSDEGRGSTGVDDAPAAPPGGRREGDRKGQAVRRAIRTELEHDATDAQERGEVERRPDTPKPVIDKLNAAIQETLSDPAVLERLAKLGQEIPPPEQRTPEALAAHQQSEIDKWWPVIKSAGIKPD